MDWTYLITAILGSTGVTALAQWLINRRLYSVKNKQQIESVWREMYESNNQAILTLNDENRKLRSAFARLERMAYKALACSYNKRCPIRAELQKYLADIAYKSKSRDTVQRAPNRYARDDPSGEGSIDNSDIEPP